MASTTFTLERTYSEKNRINGLTIEGLPTAPLRFTTLKVEITVFKKDAHVMGQGDSAGGFMVSIESARQRYRDLLEKGYVLTNTHVNGAI